MLQNIRDKATGVFAWIIVILITVPFAMWGIGEYFQTDSRLSAAEVDGEKIAINDYQQIFQSQRNRLREALGEKAAQEFDDDVLKRIVVEQLVAEAVLGKHASEAGMAIADDQLLSRVASDSQFQLNGRFNADLYARSLRSVGLSKTGYEHNLRRSMLIDQLQRGVKQSSAVSDQQLQRIVALDRQQRRVSVIRLNFSAEVDKQEVSEAAVKEYYDAHRSEFRSPEQLIIQYLDLSADALVALVELEPGELDTWFDAHSERYQRAEGREASHIQLLIPEGSDAAGAAEVEAKAIALRERLLAGEDFATLAKEFSEDFGSKDEGGQLGMVDKGAGMPVAFEAALFALESEGSISQPVKTEAGWHLIKLEKIRPITGKTLDEVRPEAILAAKRQKAEDRFFDLGEILADRSYESPDNLDVAAEAINLPVQTSTAFSRQAGEGVAANARIRDAAFADDVLLEGNNSVPIELGDFRAVVIRVQDRIPASDKPLAEVEGLIASLLKRDAAKAAAQQRMDVVVAALNAGDPAEQVAKQQELGVDDLGWIKRGRRTDGAVVREAFAMPYPLDGKASVAQTTADADELVAVIVNEVKPGDLDVLSEVERKLYRRQLASSIAKQELDGLSATLKARSEIRIFDDNL